MIDIDVGTDADADADSILGQIYIHKLPINRTAAVTGIQKLLYDARRYYTMLQDTRPYDCILRCYTTCYCEYSKGSPFPVLEQHFLRPRYHRMFQGVTRGGLRGVLV